MQQGSPDDFQTPPEALEPLLPYLKPEWTIWEPAAGMWYLVDGFQERGFNVIATDKYYDADVETGALDFLINKPPEDFDCIITNPPFSQKQNFLERCYGLEKPFALLLPLTTFETAKRQRLFRDYGVEILFMQKRVNFVIPSGKGGGSWFATAWFTFGLKIGKELNFE